MYSRDFRHCKVQKHSKWERLPSFIPDYITTVSEYTCTCTCILVLF